jgi:hypothetical protein
MSTRTTKKPQLQNPQLQTAGIELRLKGPGSSTVALFDSKGNPLMTKRLVLSGSPGVEARSILPLTLGTTAGVVAVVPALLHQSDTRQTVTLGDKKPEAAMEERFLAIRLSKSSAERIRATVRLASAQGGALSSSLIRRRGANS